MHPRTIELTFEGPVPPDDLELVVGSGVHRTTTRTVLVAEVRDSAALFGLLQRLGSLGLDVVGLRTADAAGQPEVEIVVRGALGPLMERMLAAEATTPRSAAHTYHLDDVDLAELLSRLERAAREDHDDARGTPALAGGAGAGSAQKEDTMDADLDEMGPVDYLVVEFPQDRLDGTAFPLLVDLVDRGIIRVLDFALLRKDLDGTVTGVELHEFDQSGLADLTVFAGAASDLIGDDDLDEVGGALTPGSAAGVLVYENAWAAPFATALRRGGGQVVAGGRIPIQAILAALDATEPVG